MEKYIVEFKKVDNRNLNPLETFSNISSNSVSEDTAQKLLKSFEIVNKSSNKFTLSACSAFEQLDKNIIYSLQLRLCILRLKKYKATFLTRWFFNKKIS